MGLKLKLIGKRTIFLSFYLRYLLALDTMTKYIQRKKVQITINPENIFKVHHIKPSLGTTRKIYLKLNIILLNIISR